MVNAIVILFAVQEHQKGLEYFKSKNAEIGAILLAVKMATVRGIDISHVCSGNCLGVVKALNDFGE